MKKPKKFKVNKSLVDYVVMPFCLANYWHKKKIKLFLNKEGFRFINKARIYLSPDCAKNVVYLVHKNKGVTKLVIT